jgi:hypothetical protein
LIELVWISTTCLASTISKAVTIGRRAAGLVQNGIVAAGASQIFLKSTGEILQSVHPQIGAHLQRCQTDFLCAFQFRGCYKLKSK